MFNERQIELLPERITARLTKINTEYLESIGEVIKDIGELRPSDVHKLQRMYNYGTNGKKMAEKLAKVSEKNIEEIYEIFDIVAKENYSYSKPFYKAKKKPFIPYEENEDLKKYVKSLAKQTVNEYVNLTQHTAFAVFAKDGKSIAPLFEANKNKVATSLSRTYTAVIDYAVTKVQTGVTDYNSAMRECLKALADSGIKTVDYATGYSRRLDTAVRQNILWGIKECNQNVADMVGEDFGADGYEISYHSHPRESHEKMAGQQYAKDEAKTVNGVKYPSFSEIEHLLKEPNCLHFKFSILLGISEPAYDESELARYKAEDKKKITFEGKEYTMYEASQLQRRIETEVRHQKDRSIIAKAAGDTTMQTKAQLRINQLTDKYAELSDASGLPTKMERMNVRGFKTMKLSKKELTNDKGRDIMKTGSEGMYRKIKDGKIEPMPKKQLHKIVKGFKKNGGLIQYNEQTDAYLESQHAEAITYNANTILIRTDAGRASVFEELIHATQYRTGENDGSYLSRLECEISAQKKLLKNSRAYKLTKTEIEQTKVALTEYEKELKTYNK